jgi:hypothetical protein
VGWGRLKGNSYFHGVVNDVIAITEWLIACGLRVNRRCTAISANPTPFGFVPSWGNADPRERRASAGGSTATRIVRPRAQKDAFK